MYGLEDRLADALGERNGIGRGVQASHDDGELVTAEPGNRIGLPDAAAQSLGDNFEELVADRVAERVVDALEMIEVETEHCQRLAALDAL